MREIDVTSAAYDNVRVDRKIVAASEFVERLTARRFYPIDMTMSFDWPNFQYAYPWELWLDQWELAAPPTLFVSGPFLPVPVVIPSGQYVLWPYQGPPYRRIDLRRDLNASFGNNTTPQQDIQITGTFGYWTQTEVAGTLAAAISSTTVTTIQSSIGSGADAGPGVGDLLIVDSERMIIQDANYLATAVTWSSGLTSSPPSAADNTMVGVSGTLNVGEQIIIDSEIMLVLQIVGTNVIVKRAWSGSVLATHSTSATVYANRQLTVLRGQLGTTAVTHLNGATMSISAVPSLVKELAIAEAAQELIMGKGGWQASMTPTWYGMTSRTDGQQRENAPGIGLPGLRDQVLMSYGRQARSRVV